MPRLSELETIGFSVFDIFNYPFEADPTRFDPTIARRLYREHFNEWLLAEQLGYDALFLSEHHFTAYNLLPSPNIMVGALAMQTERIRLGAMVNVLPFHEPLRLAEEGAMLDVLSGGRLEFGLGRGADFQEVTGRQLDYDEMRDRFQEGVDVIKRVWTETAVEHDGRYSRLGPISIFPSPLQKPHPPIWCAAESQTTIEWVGSQGFGMGNVFQPPEATRQKLEWYLAAGERAGHRLTPAHFMLLRHVYVAPTDEQAFEEGEAAFTAFAMLFRGVSIPPDLSILPDAYAYHREMFAHMLWSPDTFEDLVEMGMVFCGSPETVKEQVASQLETIGCRNVLLFFNYGNLTHEQTCRSLRLFAEEVAPGLRSLPVGLEA